MRHFPKVILLFCMVDWPIFMRRKMVYALAEAVRKYDSIVIAVNRPLCPFSTWVTRPSRMGEFFKETPLEKLADNLFLFSPRYVIHDHVARQMEFLEKLNLKELRRSFKWLEKELNVKITEPLVWFYHPVQGYVTKLFRGSVNVFEIKDNLVDVYGISSYWVDAMEVKYRRDVDLLLATSQESLDKYSPDYKTAWLSGNGLDRKTYERLTAEDIEPHESILEIKSPRIGYTGIISGRLDWSLVNSVIEKSSDKNFIFVGPIADEKVITSVRELPNAYFIGKVDHSQIPSVLKAFDLGWMPYRDNNFFRYSNPLKFYEFAAAGVPMVSSNMIHLHQFDRDFVRVIQNVPRLWITTLNKMLDYDRKKALEVGLQIAGRFIWEDMTTKIVERIRDHFYV